MIRNLRSRALAVLLLLVLCLGLLPVTALAAGEDAPDKLYVGNQQVIVANTVTYWTTDNSGGLTRVDDATDDSNDWTVRYDPNSATLTLNGATISGSYDQYNNPFTAGIYAKGSSNQSVALTIELIGTNTITGNYGIYVDAQQGETVVGTDALLLIRNSSNSSDSSRLEVSGSSHGIYVKSGTGNASLTIKDASVVASSSSSFDGYAGVCVQSSSDATSSPTLSLAVDGGSLTASASEGNDGIQFYVGAYEANSATTSLTVTDNAIVDARTGGISASGVNIAPIVNIGSTGSAGGIVFDGSEGTVYGDVTLDESLTIAQGETLTVPEGSTLNTNGNLTNNGTIVNEGGTLSGEPGGTIVAVSAPAITTESLPDGTVDQPYTATLEATGNNITWSVTEGALPDGLTLNESTGEITGTPATEGQFQITVTATNSVGSIDQTYTLNINLATVSVTGLKLDKDSLTLQEKGSHTLTATVEPADATNKAVTWASSDTDIATVSESGTVTAISAGSATITATAADGSGISASCNLTVTHGNMVQTPKKDATCTEEGNTEYWYCETCKKYFSDSEGKNEIAPESTAIPATSHSYENGKCTVCGAIDPNFTPEIIAGANGTWQKGTQDGLSFTSNAAFDDFIKVQVDGKDLDASNYTIKEGSTIVTLKASYLETLSVGKHTLAIVSDTGIAETEFTILAASDSDESLVQTGDNNMSLVALLSIIGAMSAVIGVVALRKSRL